MIRYFQDGLQPLIKVKIEQHGQEFNSFKEIVKKAVDAKAKATLGPRSYVCKTNQHRFQDNWLITTKANTQGQPMKAPRVKNTKSRAQKSKISVF